MNSDIFSAAFNTFFSARCKRVRWRHFRVKTANAKTAKNFINRRPHLL